MLPPESSIPERVRAAIRDASPAIWDWDSIADRLSASTALKAIFGVTNSEPFGRDQFVSTIHEEDRPLFDAIFAGGMSDGFEFRIKRPDAGDVRWLTTTVSREVIDGAMVGIAGVVHDITPFRLTAHALLESEERFRLAVEAGKMAVWEVDMTSGRLTNSAELNLLLGLPAGATPSLADVRRLYAPGELERLEREGVTYERVLERTAGGAAAVRRHWTATPAADRTQIQAEFSLLTPDGVTKRLMLRAQHAPATDGVGQRVTGILVDLTDRKMAEDRLALVARELQHRIKNTLALARVIGAQSFRGERPFEESFEAFSGRLAAIAAATDTMLEEGIGPMPIELLVERILSPHRMRNSDPFVVAGPDFALPSRLATSLGMALHEMSTNAAKYGALSATNGRVNLSWSVLDNQLNVDWAETGGPLVETPQKNGFGTRLLQNILRPGKLTVKYAPEGVRYRVAVQLSDWSDRAS